MWESGSHKLCKGQPPSVSLSSIPTLVWVTQLTGSPQRSSKLLSLPQLPDFMQSHSQNGKSLPSPKFSYSLYWSMKWNDEGLPRYCFWRSRSSTQHSKSAVCPWFSQPRSLMCIIYWVFKNWWYFYNKSNYSICILMWTFIILLVKVITDRVRVYRTMEDFPQVVGPLDAYHRQ